MSLTRKFLVFVLSSALVLSCAISQETPTHNPDGFTLVRSDYSPAELENLCKVAIEKFQVSLNQVQDLYDLDRVLTDFGDAMDAYGFMKYVSPNKELRKVGGACEEEQTKLLVEVFTRRDLYAKVKTTELKRRDDTYFLKNILSEFEANGMALSDEALEQFVGLKKDLAELQAKFSTNLNEDTSRVYYTEAELEGVPDSFIGTKKKNSKGLYEFTTKYTDFGQVMNNAKNPGTRKKMLVAYDNRAGEVNSKLLEEAIVLRARLAKILGFRTWADHVISQKMAGTSARALGLLNDLEKRLKPRLKKDMARITRAKREEEGAEAGPVSAWDVRYYINQVKKQDYSIDEEVLREYFPKDHTMAGMFEIYQTLFGVKFEEVPKANVWHKDVKLYKTLDAKTGELLAYFYMDLYPRDGKYGHAAAFALRTGRRLESGAYSVPVTSVVANFTAPTKDRPSLLTFSEVETLFHEFGHVVHANLSRSPYGQGTAFKTKGDFVEAPSQMLENWIWDLKMLDKFSGHYKDISKKIPRKMAKKLVASQDYNQGYFYSRQIVLGKTDLSIHMSDSVDDVNGVYQQMHNDILGFPTVEGSKWMAGFGHMMGGYDAGYYGYIWSEVYAADMFTAFEKRGLLNKKTGLSYRQNILEPGGMEDPFALLTKFLGRKPNNTAFLKKLGL